MTILAIDQGTTSTKGFLLHPDGRFESVGARRHQQLHPGDGLVEHDADELAQDIEDLIDEALRQCGSIVGIGIANQGETVVAWDRVSKRPVHNAIVWQDQRTQGDLERWSEDVKQRIKELSGLPLDAYFSASKLAWLLTHVPAVAEAAEAGRLGLGTSDAFFLDRLTGRPATDVTTASRTSLLNLSTLAWDDELCRLFQVPRQLLPPPRATTGAFGSVSRAGREIPVLASVVDQQAALFGHGCRAMGDMKVTFGTGSFALAVTGTEPRRSERGLEPTVAWQFEGQPAVYALSGGDYTASAAVDWAMRLGLASGLEDFDLPEGRSALQRGIVFVPALAGLAAPHWDRFAAGAFLGLRQDTTSEDVRRAVLEGVALRAAELVDAFEIGSAVKVLSVDGGLSKNRAFVQFLADVTGVPVALRDHADLTALGAAELGYVGLGLPLPPRPASNTVIEPSPASAAIRAERHRFAEAIAAVRGWGRAP